MVETQYGGKRGPYQILTPAQHFCVGKRASEYGVTATLQYYSKSFPDLLLKETSVRRMKNEYRSHLQHHATTSEVLPGNKPGKPLLLGDDLDKQVKDYIKYLSECSSAVNTAVVIAAAEEIVMNKNPSLLLCNDGGIHLTKDWAKSLLRRMGMVKRRVTTKFKVTVEEFDALREEFLLRIKSVVTMDEIPLN